MASGAAPAGQREQVVRTRLRSLRTTLGLSSNKPASATWAFGAGDACIEFTLALMIRPGTSPGLPAHGMLFAEYPVSSSEGARMVIASWPVPARVA